MKNTIKKLSRMPYASAHVEIDPDGNVYLFSYKTLVCEITTDGWLSCFGLHSATTRHHISAFVKEYITYPDGSSGDYYTAKLCFTENLRFNINTGEVEDIED